MNKNWDELSMEEKNEFVRSEINLYVEKKDKREFYIKVQLDLIRFVLAVILIALIGIFIYPGRYHYSMFQGKEPMRINNINGHTQLFYGYSGHPLGWHDVNESNQQ